MVDFSLSDEERQIRATVRSFIQKEVMPLESEVLRDEREGGPGLDHSAIRELQLKAKKAGFWGINTPEEYGGLNAGAVMPAIVVMEVGRTFVPFTFGGSADNILYAGTDEQKRRYLVPTIEGDRRSCFAITEPGAGSDARNITSRAGLEPRCRPVVDDVRVEGRPAADGHPFDLGGPAVRAETAPGGGTGRVPLVW